MERGVAGRGIALDPLAERRAEAIAGLSLAGEVGIEFGPLDRPIVTAQAARVLYADHCSAAELRAKYAGDPGVDLSRLAPVDVDLSRTTLAEAARRHGPFGFVVASHVIEHVPDPIGWLAEVAAALGPGGVVALMVPDKRFTFDLHRRETSWADLVAAHAERRARPSLGTVLDHFLGAATVDAGDLWRDYAVAADAPRIMPAEGAAELIARWSAGEYLDAHCSVWTPWTFLAQVGRAADAVAPGLRLLRADPTPPGQLDFRVQLVNAPDRRPTEWAREARALRKRAHRPELSALAAGMTPIAGARRDASPRSR